MDRPNIIFITTDQQRTDSLGCYGSGWMRTPHIDALAAEGVIFDRAYCPNPVCTPSRASILAGQYVDRHGAWNVGMNVPEDTVFLSHLLAAQGWTTRLIGKAHFHAFGGTAAQSKETTREWRAHFPGFDGPYYGFQKVELSLGHTLWGGAGHYGLWLEEKTGRKATSRSSLYESVLRTPTLNDCGAYDWRIPTVLHSSIWTAERSVAFLEECAAQGVGRKPFFLSVGFQDPHHPHALPEEIARTLDHGRVPLPLYREGELDDKPRHFREARTGTLEQSAERGAYWFAGQGKGADYRLGTPEDARLARSYYYAMVELIDRGMGLILDTLDRTGLADNTLVVFTTDHGELLGDHGLWLKGPFLYEQLARVPCIVRFPGKRFAGTRSRGIASLVDLAPTALDLAGLSVPETMDGVSLIPSLEAGRYSPGPHDAVFLDHTDDPAKLRLKCVVTERYKLTWYAGRSFGELFDLQEDPGELVNRWSDPGYADVRAELMRKLLDRAERLEKRAPRYCYA